MNKQLPMAYLATKYTSYCPIKFIAKFIMWYRYHKVSKIVIDLMINGYVVFSPITHSHVAWTKSGIKDDVQTDHDFWMEQDYWFVDRCDIMFVYGSFDKTSKGVLREIKWAKEMGTEIVYLNKKGEVIEYA